MTDTATAVGTCLFCDHTTSLDNLGTFTPGPEDDPQHFCLNRENCRQRQIGHADAGKRRATYLLITDFRLLNDWCKLVNEMFSKEEAFGCYHVGSSLERPDYRDVDIRCIIRDEVYNARYDDAKRKYLNLAVSLWGQKVTGLPIDFQIQPQSLANELYPGVRHAIGHALFDKAPV